MNIEAPSRMRDQMLGSIRAPHRLGQVGYGIILASFAIAVVNALLPEPSKLVSTLLQPLIFVGIGGLLYHIGQHVHALHSNVIRMAMLDRAVSSNQAE